MAYHHTESPEMVQPTCFLGKQAIGFLFGTLFGVATQAMGKGGCLGTTLGGSLGVYAGETAATDVQSFRLLFYALFGASIASLGIKLTLGDDKGGLALIGMSLGSSIGGTISVSYANHLHLRSYYRPEKQEDWLLEQTP